MNELEVKQANERYLLSKKQELERTIEPMLNIVKYIKKRLNNHNINDYYFSHETCNLKYVMRDSWLYDEIEKVVEYKTNVEPLYFTFGKYKGRIVQDIIQEDRDYCSWFSLNVCGRDINTLRILDYLSKSLHHKDYKPYKKEEVLEEVIKKYIPEEWQDYVERDWILHTSSGSSGYVEAYDDHDNWMCEVFSEGDLC